MPKAALLKIGLVVATAGALSLGTSQAAPSASSALELARQLNQAFVDLADQVAPSVVVIRVAHKPDYSAMGSLGDMEEDSPFREFIPRFRERFQSPRGKRGAQEPKKERKQREPVFDAQGSGIIIREDGYILTNRHVVDEAEKIKVRLKDGREFDAVVKGTDAQSDVAVIKISEKDVKGLVVAKMANSDQTKVGEFAVAIGAPFDLDYSVTFGHVSAKGRSHIIEGAPAMDQDFIQTDANINPGNSGGPLVNIMGEVIGINTLIRGLHTGIGFAIPSNLAKEVADQLIANGKFTRGWLGIAINALSENKEFSSLNKEVKEGVIVFQIDPQGPAAKSALKPADIITSVDGKPVATPQQLKNEIRSKKIGSTVVLKVYRKDKFLEVKVQPAAWPEEEQEVAANKGGSKPQATSSHPLGLTVQTLSKQLTKKYGTEIAEGVVVTDVEPDSPAEIKGIHVGDVITEVDRKSVANVKEFNEAIKAANLAKGVIVNLNSQGTGRFVILKDDGE